MAKNNKNVPEISPDFASEMLQSVFDEADVAPNTVPTEDLESYTEYREDKFRTKKVILVVILMLFLLIPLLFIAPSVGHIEQEAGKEYPKYHIDVDSILPVSSVTATLNGKKVDVFEIQPKVYSIEPKDEGEMLVKVTTINRQYTTDKIIVKAMDKEAPTVVNDNASGGLLNIYVQDKSSGVDFKSTYAMDTSGKKIDPVSYDKKTGRISFSYPKSSMNIFVPDKSGNVLQLAITIR